MPRTERECRFARTSLVGADSLFATIGILLGELLWGFGPHPSMAFSQQLASSTTEVTAEESREKLAAQRFLALLKRSPRLGTALDKVYGYHVSLGTLDSFTESLRLEATQSNDGKLWLVLGMVQMQRGQDAAAVEALERAEKMLPTEHLSSYYLGKTLLLIGELDRAAEAMRRAIERKPARGDALQIFQDLGRVYQRTGRSEQALAIWSELERLFPNDAGVQEQIAAILAEEGAEQAALERYAALAKSSKDRFRQVEMSVRAAQLKAKLGNSAEALQDFESQLTVVNPDSWLYRDIRRRIEEVFWSSGDLDGLVSYYTQWTAAHPDDVDAMLRNARVLSIQKRGPESQQWFRKALEKAPSNVEARQALIESLAVADNHAAAAEEMRQLVEIEPDNPDFIVRWGELVLSDNAQSVPDRQAAATGIWKRMLATRGDDPVAVARVADLLRGAELIEPAIEHYRKAISLAENEPQYREYLGEFLQQLQRQEEALAVWEGIASDARHTRDNIVRLSEVLSTFHYDELALEKMAEACQMKPTFGHRARYAELLREAGRVDQALEQLDLAEPMADDQELRELVIDERIKNYQARGDLADQITQLEASVAGPAKIDPAAWRLLALMREANRAFQPACDAIEQSTSLAPENTLVWETNGT